MSTTFTPRTSGLLAAAALAVDPTTFALVAIVVGVTAVLAIAGPAALSTTP